MGLSAEKIIEVKPHGGGWKVFETPGVEPWFNNPRDALDYAKTRFGFGQGELRILNNAGRVVQVIAFDVTGTRL